MNDQLLLNIYRSILKEAEIQEFSAVGGGAVGGYTPPMGYTIEKKRKKKKRSKLSEADSNIKYIPKVTGKAEINQDKWRYNANQKLIENYTSLLSAANVMSVDQASMMKVMSNAFDSCLNLNPSEAKSILQSSVGRLKFKTNLFSTLRNELMQELVAINDTTSEKLQNQGADISEEDITQALSKVYGDSAVSLFKSLVLKEKALSKFEYVKTGIKNTYTYILNAFKSALYATGIYSLFEYGGITGLLKEALKGLTGIDINTISNKTQEIADSISSGYESAKTGVGNAINYVSQTIGGSDVVNTAKDAIEKVPEVSKNFMQTAWDNFWVWDKYIVGILAVFITINVIGIYMTWSRSRTNKREALNAFINDSLQQAEFDLSVANTLAKDAAIVVMNKYFESKGQTLIEGRQKYLQYYQKPLKYYLL